MAYGSREWFGHFWKRILGLWKRIQALGKRSEVEGKRFWWARKRFGDGGDEEFSLGGGRRGSE